MDALTSGIKREIVRRVFPDLRYGGDPDVERYFELRRSGRMSEALSVYNRKLRARYPDDASRVTLLGLYRARDPRYEELLERLLDDFGSRLAATARRNIDSIARPLEGAQLSDALGALKAVESVLARFGGDSERAIPSLEEHAAYARILGHRAPEIERALALVREYDAVSRSDSPADYDFVARSAALEDRRRSSADRERGGGARPRDEAYDFVARSAEADERRRRREEERSRTRYFDPSKIRFSAEERARVEIPKALSRREDKVIAYCAKYWGGLRDPSFERMVFLYSRKYGTRHYEIFRAVKLGRARGATDDEILSAVSGILVTSYDYSVSGDLYMQVMWRRIRSRMEAREVAQRLAIPGPESKVRARSPAGGSAPESPVAAPARIAAPVPVERPRAPATPVAAPVAAPAPVERPRAPAAAPLAAPASRPRPVPASTRPARPEPARPRAVAARARAAALKAEAAMDPSTKTLALPKVEAPATTKPSLSQTSKPTGARLLRKPPAPPPPLPELKGSGSVSDKIRALSGKAYDVYHEIFLQKVRDHIRRELLAHPSRQHGLFDSSANDAEDQIFGFFEAHYDDPFMNWEASAERAAVEALGYSIPSLDPIIESCFKRL